MFRRLLSLICALVLALSMAAAFAAEARDNGVMEHFMELTDIPRPSHHEEQISSYLEKWASERGFSVKRDSANNIVFDVPATSGMEDRPLTALQAHMDMVFAQKDGLNLDPLATRINVTDDGVWMMSDGNTSLGSDDGLGIAIIMSVAEGRLAHGPMRMIITTDEEDAMTGIHAIDPSVVDGVSYLINLDYEIEGVVMISSAAGYDESFTKSCEPAVSTKDSALSISLSNLSGGHSGVQINENRLNGAVAMGAMLRALEDAGIDFELASMTAGTAKNAIVASAKAVIRVDSKDTDAVNTVLETVFDAFRQAHSESDPDMSLSVSAAETGLEVMPSESKQSVISFLTGLNDGVYTMHPTVEGLVECSSNLGVVTVNAAGMDFEVFARSSEQSRLDELLALHTELASSLGISVTGWQSSEAWAYKEDNHLLDVTEAVYRELFGTEISAQAVHAGLECGSFARMNSAMDIISIGPTIENPHTINERFEIATVEKVWQLLEAVLINL